MKLAIQERKKIMEFNSDKEAVINGLVMAVTATTDAKSDECLALVKRISSGMNELEIADCKREADKILEGITNGS